MAKRFFVKFEKCNNDMIILEGDQFNHLVNVMRKSQEELVTVFNNFDGLDYTCKIDKIEKKFAVLKIVSTKQNETEPKQKITVFQSFIKSENFELVVQKLTELGVSNLVPFVAEHTVLKLDPSKLSRFEKISIEACKQCGRAKSLIISKPVQFAEMLNLLESFDKVVFADVQATKSLNYNDFKQDEQIALVIGSEGGFTNEEAQKLRNLQDALPISLGKRILKSETASIALSTLVLHGLGEI